MRQMPFLKRILKSFSSSICLRKRIRSQWLSSFTSSSTSMCMSLTQQTWSSTSKKLALTLWREEAGLEMSSGVELDSARSLTEIGSHSPSLTPSRSKETQGVVSSSILQPTRKSSLNSELRWTNLTSMGLRIPKPQKKV